MKTDRFLFLAPIIFIMLVIIGPMLAIMYIPFIGFHIHPVLGIVGIFISVVIYIGWNKMLDSFD